MKQILLTLALVFLGNQGFAKNKALPQLGNKELVQIFSKSRNIQTALAFYQSFAKVPASWSQKNFPQLSQQGKLFPRMKLVKGMVYIPSIKATLDFSKTKMGKIRINGKTFSTKKAWSHSSWVPEFQKFLKKQLKSKNASLPWLFPDAHAEETPGFNSKGDWADLLIMQIQTLASVAVGTIAFKIIAGIVAGAAAAATGIPAATVVGVIVIAGLVLESLLRAGYRTMLGAELSCQNNVPVISHPNGFRQPVSYKNTGLVEWASAEFFCSESMLSSLWNAIGRAASKIPEYARENEEKRLGITPESQQ